MKKKIALLITILSLAICFTTNAMAGQILDRIIASGELKVGMSKSSPPLRTFGKDGAMMGFEVDIAQAMAMSMGVKEKFVTMNFAELLPALQSGKIDVIISGMTMTSDRNLKVAFVGPYHITGKTILAKHETVLKLNQEESAANVDIKLAVLKGGTGEEIAKGAFTKAEILVADSQEDALQMVLDGKANAMMTDRPFCVFSAFRHKDKDLEVSNTLTFEPLGIGLPDGDPLLINWVENFLMTIDGNGLLKQRAKFWFSNSSWMKNLP
jgi:polar amino acid transport system substrate-binding protein